MDTDGSENVRRSGETDGFPGLFCKIGINIKDLSERKNFTTPVEAIVSAQKVQQRGEFEKPREQYPDAGLKLYKWYRKSKGEPIDGE